MIVPDITGATACERECNQQTNKWRVDDTNNFRCNGFSVNMNDGECRLIKAADGTFTGLS